MIDSKEKAFAREELVYNATEDLLIVLEDMDISKKELARRLGRSLSYITQILNGSRKMTLSTLSDICFEIGITPTIHFAYKKTTHE
ncbi:helix-turn-helix domain-containing protein [Candidatus Dojkabacteria bacterium]|jgi:transcriptional regulator with XRE-family HTH domain|nr:helix-turn-helix domain-containing protein [Candidatus Dojkabacteria bacterium]